MHVNCRTRIFAFHSRSMCAKRVRHLKHWVMIRHDKISHAIVHFRANLNNPFSTNGTRARSRLLVFDHHQHFDSQTNCIYYWAICGKHCVYTYARINAARVSHIRFAPKPNRPRRRTAGDQLSNVLTQFNVRTGNYYDCASHILRPVTARRHNAWQLIFEFIVIVDRRANACSHGENESQHAPHAQTST